MASYRSTYNTFLVVSTYICKGSIFFFFGIDMAIVNISYISLLKTVKLVQVRKKIKLKNKSRQVIKFICVEVT